MRSALFRVLAVAILVFAPSSVVVGYGLASIGWSRTIWDAAPSEGPGELPVGALERGVTYRLVLTTDCFTGRDYRVQLAAWADDGTEMAVNEERGLRFTGRSCRSTFETSEFTVAGGRNYTVGWNASEEVTAHGPRIRVVEVMMPLDQALRWVLLGLYGSLNVFASTLMAMSLWRRRPPGRMPAVLPVPGPLPNVG